MGQGLHAGFVYGANESDGFWREIDTPRTPGDYESVLTLEFNDHTGMDHRHRLDYAYESEPRYCGFWVACNDPGEADDHACTEIARTSFDLAEIPVKFAAEIASARERWERFAAFCRERGVEVGPGRLLYVGDWD